MQHRRRRSDVSLIVHSCASLPLRAPYPSHILVADIPTSLVERKGFIHRHLAEAFCSRSVLLSLFSYLALKKKTPLKILSSGSAPASSLFLVWQLKQRFSVLLHSQNLYMCEESFFPYFLPQLCHLCLSLISHFLCRSTCTTTTEH